MCDVFSFVVDFWFVLFFHCGQINTKSYSVSVSLLRIALCLTGLRVLESAMWADEKTVYFAVFDGMSCTCLLCITF